MPPKERNSKGPLSLIILDEIGLEGLEGLSIDGLWIRLSEALCLPLPLQEHFQNQIWEFLKIASNEIEFYELTEPREKLKTFDRFKCLNPESGFPIVPDECPETRYKLCPIQTNNIMGSCQFFNERKLIPFSEVFNLKLEEVIERYGDKFIIVGNQELRESILYSDNIQKPDEITKQQYCMLEMIGRSRYNGEKTAGKYSLQNYCKDSADLFYMRNRLLSQNLIVKQPYTEYMGGRSMNAYLLSLPRFFIEHKTKPVAIVEVIFNILQNEHGQKMEYDKLKLKLAKDYVIYLKKLQLSPIFKNFFEIFKAPYRTIHTDAPRSQWKRKGVDEEKQLILIRLKNQNITLEDIFNEDNLFTGSSNTVSGTVGDSTETDKIEFVNPKHFYIDMPFLEQVYRLIEKQGSVGFSQPQLQRLLVVERYTVRALLKQIVKTGLVTHYWQEFGRQKTIMYVARKHAKNMQNTNSQSKNDIETLKCHDINVSSNNLPLENLEENNINDKSENILSNITAVVKDISLVNEGTGTAVNLKHQTIRQLRRQKIIVSTVNEQTIIDKISIRRKIMSIEKSNGYKDQICSKSLNRIINWLTAKNIVKVYEITLEMRKCIKCYRYIVHPKLEPNHQLLQDEINKLKNQLHLNVEEREMREQVIAKRIHDKENSTSTKSNSRYSNFYRRAPKFLTSRFFHEFLYYLVYEMNPDTQPIPIHDNIVKMLIESSPQYDLNNLTTDLQTHYTDNLSWKMFIPPLPRSSDKPYGWAYIMDVFIRVPLSLLMKLYQIDRNSNELLNEYLNHPIKQHYLLQRLPPELQDFIFKLRMGKTSLHFFKILSLIGLVQLGKRNQRDPKESWFYLNRNAKLLDTSISEPGYRFISPDKNYQKYNYRFDTFQDVQNYWNCLYKTCCLTRLGVRIDVQQKNRQQPTELSPVEFEMAVENDIGYIPGDGRGAGGFDSLLFAHLKSNWSWSVKLAKKKISVKTSALSSQRIKLGELNANKKNLKNISTGTKRKITVVPTKKIKRRLKSISTGNATSTKKSKSSSDYYDDIDRDALNRMDSLRVQWNKDEDHLLKVCRAVFIYLNNFVSQLNRVINAHNYRDILHWALNSRNKTSKACQRRILFIFKKHQNTDISAWVHELKRNLHIKQRFGTKFLDNLRKIYPDDVTFSEALKVHFVQLVYYLNKIIKNANLSIENQCILPDTLMQFNRFYKECFNISPSYKDDDIKHFNPKSIDDIEISTINSLMHSTMCCNRDKTLYNIQIFEIYKNFKEETLSKAFKKAKDDCLVVATKSTRNSVSSVTGPSFVLSVKYRQALYLNIPYEILEKCFETFEIFLSKFFSRTRKNEENSIDFKTINSGVFYLLTEMCAQNQILINIQMPQKILTIDPTQQQNVNDSERILDHFRQIFDNAPKQEYLKVFETDNNKGDSKTKQRIKFNIANENYKLNYNPFNILSKLSDNYLHFFCALDHLNKILDLDFTRFASTDNFCPFSNCVLKNTNFINVIERIIHEKKSVIEDLLRTNETEEIVENIVILNQKNIMQIYSRLQDTLTLRNRLINLKDYGKIKISLQSNNLDILRLCKDLMDYKESDEKNQQIEYVPILNKEEKIIRAHDIFVVNLPTLKVSLNDNEFIDSETKKYKEKLIPKKLIQPDIDREAILKKIHGFFIWSHFGNMDKLREDEEFKSYTTSVQSDIIAVLLFINMFPLGATTKDLVKQFKDEIFLVNATRILRKHYLIMRVGIENFIYVHKNYITNWIIQTYHIKRLDKESLQQCLVTVVSEEESEHQKRKISETDNEEITDKPATKQLKTNEGKRISIPVKRFDEKNDTPKTKTFTPKEKETIIIRPCPWIRINGSLNRRVLDRWLGCVVIDCLSNCGQTIRKLCTTFNQMHPVNLMCLLEILLDLNCIKCTRVSKPQKPISLFTKYEYKEEEIATEFSDMDEVFITTTPNAIINTSLFIGDKKYVTDFI